MGEVTAIEWCDHTWNPWLGCTKVSVGPRGACNNCYAEDLMDTRYGRVQWGSGQPRTRTAPGNWAKLRTWNRAAEANGSRPFVFSLSLGDIFDNEVDPEWRREAFAEARACPSLVMLYLTKRIGNAEAMSHEAGGLPENAALGATMVTQEEYDRERMKLHRAKESLGALFTFGSFEPLLGPVILDKHAPDWIIVGGESGRNARPMKLEWARSLKHQSAVLGRVFNFKQVGGRDANKGGHALDGTEHFARPSVRLVSTSKAVRPYGS